MFKRPPPPALDDESLARVRLAPQLLDYDHFAKRSHAQYLPYVMSFNPANYRSAAINTDALGFRYSITKTGEKISVETANDGSSDLTVNLLVGASPALGYGATSDAATVTSRLSAQDPAGLPWLNFAGHCYNSVQELMLFLLHKHRLPRVQRIVVMGGFNTLVMARLPEFQRGGLPPFYFCGEFYEKFDEIAVANGGVQSEHPLPKWPQEAGAVPPIHETIEQAVCEISNTLTTWSAVAKAMGAELNFLQQPLATWVRPPCKEEKILFDELDQISRLGTWQGLYGDISGEEVGEKFALALREVCESAGVPFQNLVPKIREQSETDWLFVDRAHFTDLGNEIVAQAIHETIHQ